MDNEKQIQAEMARAQAGLEDKLARLKDAVHDKLETPERVIDHIEKSSAWVAAHRDLLIVAVAGLLGSWLVMRFVLGGYRLARR